MYPEETVGGSGIQHRYAVDSDIYHLFDIQRLVSASWSIIHLSFPVMSVAFLLVFIPVRQRRELGNLPVINNEPLNKNKPYLLLMDQCVSSK